MPVITPVVLEHPEALCAPSLPPRGSSAASFSQLDLYANIETIGVVVSGENLTAAAELAYRRSGDAGWRTGHPLVRIDGGRLVGSAFWMDCWPASGTTTC